MAVVWCWARAELRRRWTAWLSIALLVGIGGGLAMAAASAARRTDSAYPRFLDGAAPPDLVLDPDFEVDTAAFLDAVAEVPGVADRSDARALALARVIDGRVVVDDIGTTVASIDGERFYEQDRVHVVEGRMPAPDRTDEVLVSSTAATDEGLAVGDRITFAALDVEAAFASMGGGGPAPSVEDALAVFEVRVTGIGVFPELAVTEEVLAPDVVLVTPALHRAVPEASHLWSRVGVHLEPGADSGAVQRRIEDLAAEHGGDTFFEDRADITLRAQRAVRPYVLALGGLAAAGAAFVALLSTQLVRRSIAQGAADRRVLVALSARTRIVRAAAALPAALAAAVAVAVALAVQLVASRWTPVGPVHAIEPDPGMQVDWVVAGPGAAVLAAVCVLPPLAAPIRARASRSGRSALTSWATQAGAPLPVVLGVGRATGLGDRSRRSSARSGLASVGLAIGMLVAVATFGGSLDHLVDHPEVHGWNADVALLGSGGYGRFDLQGAADVDGVTSLTAGVFGNIGIEDTSVPGLGLVSLRGDLLPPIVEGRAPSGWGEVALGQRSLDEVGARIGDVVDVQLPGEEPSTMTVVGTTVLPGLGPIDNDRPTLGDGALVVLPPDEAEGEEMGWSLLLAELEPDADATAVTADLVAGADEQTGETDVFELFRPADIAAFADVGAVPPVLTGLFGLVALASLVHVLLVTGRSWRRDRAVLAALGATPGQLRRAVRWQAVAMVGISLLVALPLGTALGRRAWRSLAQETGIAPEPIVPVAAVAAALGVLLVVALLATALPERRAALRRPADHLRAE